MTPKASCTLEALRAITAIGPSVSSLASLERRRPKSGQSSSEAVVSSSRTTDSKGTKASS